MGYRRVEEMRKGERTSVGGVTVTATYALHDGGRGPFGVQADTLGFIVGDRLVDGKPSIYFAGDTDVFPAMADMAGSLDLALLPVWGWGPTLGAGHMDPQRAAEAAQLLAPAAGDPHPLGHALPAGHAPHFARVSHAASPALCAVYAAYGAGRGSTRAPARPTLHCYFRCLGCAKAARNGIIKTVVMKVHGTRSAIKGEAMAATTV